MKDRNHVTTLDRLNKHYETKRYSLPDGVDQFQILRIIKRIGKQLGLNESIIAQYELMISYTNQIDWKAGNLCICWLSVERMTHELGKSIRQVQYNTDKLVELGLISMKLSGNYRRGGQRDQHGKIIWASGVDMKPVIEQLEQLQRLDQEQHDEIQTRNLLSKEISSLRRQMRSFLGNYPELEELSVSVTQTVNIRPRLSWSIDRLKAFWDQLNEIWQSIVDVFHSSDKENDGGNCMHGCNELQTLYKCKDHDLI